MRQIEERMVAAIFDGNDWRSGNTRVEWHGSDYVRVELHGHPVAQVVRTPSGEWQLHLDDAGWQTRTTKSRLNALLCELVNPRLGIVQDDWCWYLSWPDRGRTTWHNRMPFAATLLNEAFASGELTVG